MQDGGQSRTEPRKEEGLSGGLQLLTILLFPLVSRKYWDGCEDWLESLLLVMLSPLAVFHHLTHHPNTSGLRVSEFCAMTRHGLSSAVLMLPCLRLLLSCSLLIAGAVYSQLNLSPSIPWLLSVVPIIKRLVLAYNTVAGSKKVRAELPGLWGPMFGHSMHTAFKLAN